MDPQVTAATAAASPANMVPALVAAWTDQPCRQPVAGEKAAVENTCCGLVLSAPHTAGPFLKFWGLERLGAPTPRTWSSGPGKRDDAAAPAGAGSRYTWVGSILLVTKAPKAEVAVEIQDAQGMSLEVLSGEELESYHGWSALRFMMRLPVKEEETEVRYSVKVSGQLLQPRDGGYYSFYIAGNGQPAHWGFYSCSGFTPDVAAKDREGKWRGLKPMWEDVKAVHAQKPLHFMVGGGDQLYCDDVWKLPSLRRFLDMPRDEPQQRTAKMGAAFEADMRDEVEAYYFNHYCCHFGQEVVGDMYAAVPQIMTWDDHDIFDGWGSYPGYLQKSKVFAGIFESANRWYCVFQQHCNTKEKDPVKVYEISSRTAIVVCDQREHRLPDQILPLEHYGELSMLITNIPKGLEHVVFVSTVPVVYPHVLGARSVLSILRNRLVRFLVNAMGVSSPINDFQEPELLDDLDDHWSAPGHQDERRFLIEHLQMLSKQSGCRVALLSGDVHVCGVGRLHSKPAPKEELLLHDYRFMPQIISSAIANPPPPNGLMRMLELFSGGGAINSTTAHSMSNVIRTSVGVRKPLDNKRNWCEVLEHPVDDAALGGHVTFRLRVEDAPGSSSAPKIHEINVPPLKHVPGTDNYLDVRDLRKKAVTNCCSC